MDSRKESVETSKESIRNEQEKDPTLKLMLQWKRSGEKPNWQTVAPYDKELKVYRYQWEVIEIRDEILCKKHIRDDGTGTDYLYITPLVCGKSFSNIYTLMSPQDIWVVVKPMRKWGSVSIGVICTGMCPIGAGYVLLVAQGNSHHGEQKLRYNNIMLAAQWKE